jgi:hypothetical protein
MTKIVLTDQQVKAMSDSNGADIILVDSTGKRVGSLLRPLFTDEEVAEAERRANAGGPWYTTEQVLAHLRSIAPE